MHTAEPFFNYYRADYNRFFTIVKEEMQNINLTLQPTTIMADFEH